MKRMTALLVLVFILVGCSSYALAWAPRVDGQPDDFRPGDSRGVFIWHNGEGLHLRTTTYGHEHVFSGTIRTDGRFVDVHGVREEVGDWHHVDWDHNTINFKFTTAGGVDGLNFKIEGGDRVYFDLFCDGHKVGSREIYIGHRGWHPENNPFTLHR